MKRDVIYLNDLVIAADNSGSIGEKPGDTVQAEYSTVGYFSARVSLMECLAAGGEPFAAVLQNFAGKTAWKKLTAGVKQAAKEAGCTVEVTGSTETNFVMNESAVSITVIGRRERDIKEMNREDLCYGVVGKPLVGPEVLAEPESVAPLSVFRQILHMPGVQAVQPVGSKGIHYELVNLGLPNGICNLDMKTSAGPATCFIVAVQREAVKAVEEAAGNVSWIK